jgi:hypothetical protein
MGAQVSELWSYEPLPSLTITRAGVLVLAHLQQCLEARVGANGIYEMEGLCRSLCERDLGSSLIAIFRFQLELRPENVNGNRIDERIN